MIVAANPAAPADTLENLSQHHSSGVRRTVASNPNTPVARLYQLALEFPKQFLANPMLPLLNLADPDHFKKFSNEAWLHFLRSEQIPPYWLEQKKSLLKAQKPARYSTGYDRSSFVLPTMEGHVLVAGEATGDWRKRCEQEVAAYFPGTGRGYHTYADRHLISLLGITFPDVLLDIHTESNRFAHSLVPLYADLPEKLLVADVKANEVWRCNVARHPCTSPQMLQSLAGQTIGIDRALAYNLELPDQLIQQMITHSDPSVRQAIIHHPRLPIADLELRTCDDSLFVRIAVAKQQRITETIADILVKDDEPEVRATLARNVHTPQQYLRVLAADDEALVRGRAARNVRLPRDLFADLVLDDDDEVRLALAENTQLPASLFWTLADWDDSQKLKGALAANPRLPRELLGRLMWQGGPGIWRGIARNPHVRPEWLQTLAQTNDDELIALVAKHKKTPVETLRWLVREKADKLLVLTKLASNPHTPLDVLEEIVQILARRQYGEDLSRTYQKILHHPVVRQDGRRILVRAVKEALKQSLIAASIYTAELRLAMLKLPDLPVALLEALAISPFWQERYLVVRHLKTPIGVLRSLSRDGHRYVRAAARDELSKLT